ncbi:unnamed protein product [Adineta steineri]|uniref:VLIG-type G domain-containing protein n=1 Tax=Adineta steineri TaxID=433720 RepID=A0A813WG44_9BILA|nr:unnamed protein product [Adineta steineri]CAF3965078.1 unnamed protein product [Adineta steineri]
MDFQRTETDTDNISLISSVTQGTTFSTVSIANTTSNISINSNIAEQIGQVLELDCVDEKDRIISDLLRNGRQALVNYQDVLIPEIYSDEINNSSDHQSLVESDLIEDTPLLKLIKQYVDQQWQISCMDQPKILELFATVKDENNDHFQAVVHHIAEYGSTYTKSSSILVVVILMLFSGIDDHCLKTKTIFNDLWNTITTQGLQSCTKFAEYISEDSLNEQLNDSDSPLFLALSVYYREKVSQLFKQYKIPDTKDELYDLAAKNVSTKGWLDGIQSIKKKIPPVKYEPLLKEVQTIVNPSVPVAETHSAPTSISYTTSATLLHHNTSVSNTMHSEGIVPTNQSNVDVIQPTVQTQMQPPVEQIFSNNSSVPTISDEYEEIVFIRRCFDKDSLQLQHLMDAGELKYINKTLRDISEEIVNRFYSEKITFSQFIHECLVPIMFLLKRQQNLDDFMKILIFIYQKKKPEQSKLDFVPKKFNLNLRTFIHILILNSDLFLCRTIMSLISKRNPVPFIEPDIEKSTNEKIQYNIIPSIIHIWNTKRPTLLSFGIDSCRGKSSLINTLFQSTFERHVNSVYFQCTVDIDFGYAFIPERPFNVADCHGQIPKDLLRKISPLFDGFLIHISQVYLEQNQQLVTDLLQVLPRNKFQFILVRDISEGFNQKHMKEILSSSSIYPLSNLTDTHNDGIQFTIQDLRDQLTELIKSKVQTNVDKDQPFDDLYQLFNSDYITYLKNTDRIIKPLKRCLLSDVYVDDNKSFPLYLKFTKLCKLRQELKKIDFYGSDSERLFKINNEIFELESELNPNNKKELNYNQVFQYFMDLLKTENMMVALNILAGELKQELLSQGADKLAGQLTKKNAFLSLDVLWRNCIVCYDHTSSENQQLIIDSYTKFILNGYPFEVIDGDNFYCQQKFLTEIMKQFANQRILVISVIGPQNSGKSTLLNYMFGTLFDVRDGRCTRGIYGSIIKSHIEGIDYILLIDTEGLLSIEKSDKEYDRRLVLFCLAVSHLVIVNMLGDINEVLKDMLTLCADSLKQLRVNTIQQPVVHFILNQKADPDIKNHIEAINKIISDLKDKELGEIINISTETFHTLPSAFKKERIANDTTGPCLLRTEPDFSEQTQKLVSRIVTSAKTCYDNARDTNFSLQKWLDTSGTIFNILQKFPDLTYFKDISERRQDDKIRLRIGEMISETLSSVQREKIIKENSNKNEQEIRDVLQAQFQDYQDKLSDKLENIFKLENASDRIRDRSRQFLQRQVTEIQNAWRISTIEANDRTQMEALVRHGAADLRQLIDSLITRGRTMTRRHATAEFEQMWKIKLDYICTNFNCKERRKQAIKFVYSNYNIFEKKMLPAHDSILRSIQLIDDLSNLPSMEVILDKLKDIFANTIKSNQHNLLQTLQQKRSTLTETTIENFTHLNKQIVLDYITSYQMSCGNEKSPEYEITSATAHTDKSGFTQRAKRFVQGGYNKFKGINRPSPTHSHPKPVTNDVKSRLQQTILDEMRRSMTQPNILYLPNIFNTILKSIENTIIGSGNTSSQNMLNETDIIGANRSDRRPIENDIIQTIVGHVNTCIDEINLELINFDLSLSRNLIPVIHELVIIFLTVLYYIEQKQHFQQQLDTLHKEKPSLLNYFISMIVPDVSCDKEGGEIFAYQIRDTLRHDLTKKAHQIISDNTQKQQNISRKDLQGICDAKLNGADEQWILRYIDRPTDIIVEEFQFRWSNIVKVIEEEIRRQKNTLKTSLIMFFHAIRSMETALVHAGSANQFVDDLFLATSGTAEENLKNKGQCMVLLLYSYLKNETIQLHKHFNVFNHTYTLTARGVQYFQRLSKIDPELASLIDLISKSNDTTRVSSTNASRIRFTSIRNFQYFLKSILHIEEKVIKQYDDIPIAFTVYDKDRIYMKLQSKAKGCVVKCPCCQRPCDADHSLVKSNSGDEDNKHHCTTGHQLRAFAGIKFETTNEASLYQCNEINNNDYIIVKGTRKKWSAMKRDYPQWDFDVTNSPNELSSLKSKFLYIWGKVGKKFCEKYNMEYVTINTPRPLPEAFHYILLLDSSGSMLGKPWIDLIAATTLLLQARIDGGTDDRISIITFNYEATLVCTDQPMSAVDLSKIACTKDGTRFEPAFQLVNDIIQRSNDKKSNLKYIIVFMSDGQADYPEIELKILEPMLNDQIQEFWTVALGEGNMSILEQINLQMKGIFKQLKDSSELSATFAEIAHG